VDLNAKDISTFEYASGRYSVVVVHGQMNLAAF